MLALALAIAPVAALIWYVTFLDRLNKEPIRMLILTVLFGMVSVVPAIILEIVGGAMLGTADTLWKIAIDAFVVVAFSEELAKYLFLRLFVFNSRHFDEPYDGIVYAVMVSLGFAGVENILYVMGGGLDVAISRMFTAVPAHATFAVMMGYFMGIARMSGKNYYNWIGLAAAILFHGAYDFFLFSHYLIGQATGAFISLGVAVYLSKRAIRYHLRYKKHL